MFRLQRVLHKLRHREVTHKVGFLQLFISKRLIHGLATAMLAVFVPIFLFEQGGNSFWLVGLFYIVASLFYALLLPVAMKVTNGIGFSKALALAMVFAVLNYTAFFFIDADNLWYLLPIAMIGVVGFRLFHWVPYLVDFTSFTTAGSRGKDVSLMFATIAFMGMVGPILAAFIISLYGYSAMFLFVIVLLTLAAISYMFVPGVSETYSWSYGETVRQLTSQRFRPIVVADFAFGAESILNLVAWPVFIYVLLEGDIMEIGGLTGLIVAVTIIVQMVVGKYIDSDKEGSIVTLRRGSFFHAVGWMIKIFVVSGLHIFLIGLYHNLTRIFLRTPYATILYDASGDQGHYVDEFTVIREVAHHLGRTVALVLMVITTFFIPLELTFVIGVVASLTMNVVTSMRA